MASLLFVISSILTEKIHDNYGTSGDGASDCSQPEAPSGYR